jgi:hypothetical protein
MEFKVQLESTLVFVNCSNFYTLSITSEIVRKHEEQGTHDTGATNIVTCSLLLIEYHLKAREFQWFTGLASDYKPWLRTMVINRVYKPWL